jgi:chromosome segregation ATPase
LARAQGEMVKVLEAKVAQQEHVAASLSAARAELDRLASTAGAAGLAFMPVALRSLAAAEGELSTVNMSLDALRKDLLAAKGREKALENRARLLRSTMERKAAEENALETALVMAAKASGKHDVVS